MKKEYVWNAVLAAIGTSALAIVGWLSLSVIQLQNKNAADDAEEALRQDITDVMYDVDKRLAVIEALIKNDSRPVSQSDPFSPSPPAPIPNPDITADSDNDYEPRQEAQLYQMQIPRYDLRGNRYDD